MNRPPEQDDQILARLRALALSFPEAAEKVSHGSLAFFTTRVFAYYGGSEKVDGRQQRHAHGVLVLCAPDERRALVEDSRCFVPAYLGPYGWIGLDLDGDPDWVEVAELLDASYRLTAGPRRVRLLDARADPDR